MSYSAVKTKRAVIEEALRTFVALKAQERRLATYGDRLRRVREELSSLVLRESPHEILRRDRNRR